PIAKPNDLSRSYAPIFSSRGGVRHPNAKSTEKRSAGGVSWRQTSAAGRRPALHPFPSVPAASQSETSPWRDSRVRKTAAGPSGWGRDEQRSRQPTLRPNRSARPLAAPLGSESV